ncbi:hypothetical protein [Kribbella sp. CA-293567]|uniref:hypothetical protein n=1 Tax=Kribbella sp. CA-293567 TaxID=3002436 RepID=UPI0022DD249B|nr:hypothetical protein [Kribbella sp. CA-293567]WBQ06687.1 hypothetical protein OX958_07795 [Kribbella sp. CA-293567]
MQSRPVEIACDESGFTGTNMLDPEFELITHVGLSLDQETAAAYVALLHQRFRRYSATEYKSGQLFRNRLAVEWLLGTLSGRATVHLTDKTYFTVTRLVDLLVGEPSYAAGTSLALDLRPVARTLHHTGPVVFGPARWRDFLAAFVGMMRHKRYRGIDGPYVAHFLKTLDDLRSERLDPILGELREARPQLFHVLTELQDDRSPVPPPLEPLIPALFETARLWTADGAAVAILHDEQSALTHHRVTRVQELLRRTSPIPEPLLGLTMLDSRTDPRIQLADLLAGVARHLATAELRHRGNPYLTSLLRPYLAATSLWADQPSWHRLTGSFVRR